MITLQGTDDEVYDVDAEKITAITPTNDKSVFNIVTQSMWTIQVREPRETILAKINNEIIQAPVKCGNPIDLCCKIAVFEEVAYTDSRFPDVQCRAKCQHCGAWFNVDKDRNFIRI